jgi:alcohol dehydrogenase
MEVAVNTKTSKQKHSYYTLQKRTVKKIDPSALITHHYKLDEIPKAYDIFLNAAKEKAMKIVIEVN